MRRRGLGHPIPEAQSSFISIDLGGVKRIGAGFSDISRLGGLPGFSGEGSGRGARAEWAYKNVAAGWVAGGVDGMPLDVGVLRSVQGLERLVLSCPRLCRSRAKTVRTAHSDGAILTVR